MKSTKKDEAPKSFWQKIAFVVTFYGGTLLPELVLRHPHWHRIVDGLYLGGLPIASKVAGFGDHRDKIIADCQAKGRPLGAVYSIVNPFEIKGEGLGLKPVSPAQWEEKGVKHHLVPMDDFGGNIDVQTVKDIVDDMKKHIDKGESVYVHCKAGKGRSFSFVAAYLLLNTDLDVTQIFALIRQQRPQVSPSSAQFRLIEQFRAAYCPHKAPLNTNSQYFQPYRKDWFKYKSNPTLHAGAVGLIARALGNTWALGGAWGAGIGLVSTLGQYLAKKFDRYSYESMKNKKEVSKLTLPQLEAVKSGLESGESWKGWSKHLFDVNASLHYSCYRGGVRLKQELEPVCQEIPKAITRKQRQKH